MHNYTDGTLVNFFYDATRRNDYRFHGDFIKFSQIVSCSLCLWETCEIQLCYVMTHNYFIIADGTVIICVIDIFDYFCQDLVVDNFSHFFFF